jgi:hypothetical protein
VAECAGLRRLSLDGLVKEYWPPILTAPALRRLESLTLRDAAQNDCLARWAAIFSNLSALRSLTLRRCLGLDTLLPAVVAHCTALRSLCISSEHLHDTRPSAFHTAMPSTDQLAELLAALPDWTAVELELPPEPLPSPAPTSDLARLTAGAVDSSGRVHWLEMRSRIAAFQEAHPHRVRLLIQEEGRD